jgi:hypothetical protein
MFFVRSLLDTLSRFVMSYDPPAPAKAAAMEDL